MKNWYKEWFSSKFYLQLYRHRNEEDARHLVNLFQRSVSINTKAKVLDIACGAGRHSLELARRGFDVTGFDLSKFLILEAKKSLKSSKERDLKVKFFIRDMKNFDFKNSFDAAVNFFTSFGYFDTDEENSRVIKNASDSLKTGGYFVFDFLNQGYLKKNIVPYSKDSFNGVNVIQKRKIINEFIKKEITIKSKNGIHKFSEKLRLYNISEFKKIFGSYRLKIQTLLGDYYGNKFNESNSPRLIIIAKKN